MPTRDDNENVENGQNNSQTSPSWPKHLPSLKRRSATEKALEAMASDKKLRWGTRRALARYYRRQQSVLHDMIEMEQVHSGTASFDESEEEKLATRALNISFASNVLLLFVRTGLVALTGSLSLIIAMIDAILDVMSSAMMFWAARESKKLNKYRYPVGKHRLEPLGVVVFSCVMGTAAFTIVVESIRALIDGKKEEDGLSNQWIVIGGTIFVVSFKMALFLYCRRSKSVGVQAFATDHLNDVVVNSCSLGGALLGANVQWWIDPAVAMALSFWVMYAWGRQGLAQLVSLVGVSAPPEYLQKLTYLAFTHRPEVVREIDTVRAYTAGAEFIAEVDIVLAPEMPLKEAHDVGEELQIKLESLPGITRAFVHLDIESRHAPEH